MEERRKQESDGEQTAAVRQDFGGDSELKHSKYGETLKLQAKQPFSSIIS